MVCHPHSPFVVYPGNMQYVYIKKCSENIAGRWVEAFSFPLVKYRCSLQGSVKSGCCLPVYPHIFLLNLCMCSMTLFKPLLPYLIMNIMAKSAPPLYKWQKLENSKLKGMRTASYSLHLPTATATALRPCNCPLLPPPSTATTTITIMIVPKIK